MSGEEHAHHVVDDVPIRKAPAFRVLEPGKPGKQVLPRPVAAPGQLGQQAEPQPVSCSQGAPEAVFAELRRREGQKFYRELIAEPRPQQPRAAIRHIVRGRLNWMRRDPVLYAPLETEVPRAAIAEIEAEIFDDFLGISIAYLEAHRNMLRPEADSRFLAEFLMHTVSATANTYGLRAPDQLDDPRLEQAIIEMVERYLLNDDC